MGMGRRPGKRTGVPGKIHLPFSRAAFIRGMGKKGRNLFPVLFAVGSFPVIFVHLLNLQDEVPQFRLRLRIKGIPMAGQIRHRFGNMLVQNPKSNLFLQFLIRFPQQQFRIFFQQRGKLLAKLRFHFGFRLSVS